MNEQVQIDKSVVKPRRFRVRNLVRFFLMIVVPPGLKADIPQGLQLFFLYQVSPNNKVPILTRTLLLFNFC